jgi:2'-5' RNA ligase
VSEPRLRLFFALWPDPPIQAELARWASVLHTEIGGRRIPQDSLHMTLAFLGDTDPSRLETLRQIGEGLPRSAIPLSFEKVRCWRHNRIAWAAARQTPAELLTLVDALRDRLGAERFPIEDREFSPHISLLRNTDCIGLRWHPPVPLEWRVTRLALVRSILGGAEGSRYQPLADWRLETGD